MSDSELDALEALANAATEGPWYFHEGLEKPNEYGIEWPIMSIESPGFDRGDIADMCIPSRGHPELDEQVRREAVPKLLAEVRRLRHDAPCAAASDP